MQTTYDRTPAVGLEGMLAATVAHTIESFAADGALKAGTVCQRSTDGTVKYPSAVVDDPDSILASGGASAVAAQTLDATDFDGEIGSGRIIPAQRLSMTLNSHADWDATTAVFTGEIDGHQIVEEVDIPNGGNTTISTKHAFDRLTSVDIPAQSGANGTFTIGTLNDDQMILSRNDFLGVPVKLQAREPITDTVIAGVQADYADEDMVSVLTRGRIWVRVEAAVVAGDPPYVRMTESGTDIRGQFRGSPAAGFAKYPGARFVTAAAQDGLAMLEL